MTFTQPLKAPYTLKLYVRFWFVDQHGNERYTNKSSIEKIIIIMKRNNEEVRVLCSK